MSRLITRHPLFFPIRHYNHRLSQELSLSVAIFLLTTAHRQDELVEHGLLRKDNHLVNKKNQQFREKKSTRHHILSTGHASSTPTICMTAMHETLRVGVFCIVFFICFCIFMKRLLTWKKDAKQQLFKRLTLPKSVNRIHQQSKMYFFLYFCF